MEGSSYLPEPKEPLPQRLGKLAKQLAAGGSGVAATGASGNPLVGVAAGVSVDQIGNSILAKLNMRPADRTEETVRAAEERIRERTEAGETPREGFAVDENDAMDLVETALRASWRSTEQRKAELIGRLIASACFDEALSLADILQNLRLMELLSWRQIMALAWIQDEGWREQREKLGAEGSEGSRQLRPGFETELSELSDTYGLIGFGQDGGDVAKPAGTFGGGQITASSFGRLTATGAGQTLHRLAELSEAIATDEIEAFVSDETEI